MLVGCLGLSYGCLCGAYCELDVSGEWRGYRIYGRVDGGLRLLLRRDLGLARRLTRLLRLYEGG